MISDDRKKVLLLASPTKQVKDNSALLKAIGVSSLDVKAGGGMIVGNDLTEAILTGVETAEFDTLPIILVLLVLCLGGLYAGLTPWLVCAFAIFATLAILVGLDYVAKISGISSNVVTMFGLGLGIDYSLFIVSRFKEEKLKHPSLHVTKILQRTLDTSGRTVLFSAVTVFFSLSGGLLFHEFFLDSMCLAVMLAVMCASIAACSLLLALLGIMNDKVFELSTEWLTSACNRALWSIVKSCTLLGKGSLVCPLGNDVKENPANVDGAPPDYARVPSTSTKAGVAKGSGKSEIPLEREPQLIESGFWYNLGTMVLDHPWLVASVSSSGLIVLSIIFLVYAKFGLTDPQMLHPEAVSRQVYDAYKSEYRLIGSTNLYVFLKSENHKIGSAPFLTALRDFNAKVSRMEGVTQVNSMISPGNYSFTFEDYLDIYSDPYNPQWSNFTSDVKNLYRLTDLRQHTQVQIALSMFRYGKTAKSMVRIFRDCIVETFVNATTGASLLEDSGVTGDAAVVRDLYEDLQGSLPAWLGIMFTSVFVLLLIMTKSILIPIKAVVLSVLSLGATFGFLVLIFGRGGLSRELDFTANGYIDGSNVIFIFSIAFGLSVDYELFLISQIQENYLLCKDTRKAILLALQKTGGIITSAAIMLSLVTAAFLNSAVSFIKLIGMGIAIAVMLDATIVRMLLVPATITLFGSWNWYCPEFLVKAIDWLNIQEPKDTLYDEYERPPSVGTADDLLEAAAGADSIKAAPMEVESVDEEKCK